MEIMYQYSPLTMGWCIDCHRESNVDKDNEYYQKVHEELSKKYGVEELTVAQLGGIECAKCHYQFKMGKKNIYWKGFEELNKSSEIVEKLEQNEFVEKLPVGEGEQDVNPNRRDFLKYAGFSLSLIHI